MQKQRVKTSMSVPEMGKMLGLGKVESLSLIHILTGFCSLKRFNSAILASDIKTPPLSGKWPYGASISSGI